MHELPALAFEAGAAQVELAELLTRETTCDQHRAHPAEPALDVNHEGLVDGANVVHADCSRELLLDKAAAARILLGCHVTFDWDSSGVQGAMKATDAVKEREDHEAPPADCSQGARAAQPAKCRPSGLGELPRDADTIAQLRGVAARDRGAETQPQVDHHEAKAGQGE